MKTWKYNKDKKQFDITEQKSLSAYSYKTPTQFLLEKGYKDKDLIDASTMRILCTEYIQNQILIPDFRILDPIIKRFDIASKKYNEPLEFHDFDSIMVSYANQSGSTKLKFLIDLWKKD